MSIIRPGKLGIVRPKPAEGGSESNREVWDDFSRGKKGKKKEYERIAGNFMRAKKDEQKPAPVEVVEEDTGPVRAREDFEVLEAHLNYVFQERSLLRCAVTHRSALGVRERVDYERLEFLGDAVLDLAIAHLLSDGHPEAREGDLSKMRAALVNTQALANVAKELEVGPFVRLGRGESSTGGAERPSILADVMEAIVGAIYRDGGYAPVFAVIERVFGPLIHDVTPFDPKTELQELLHVAGSEPPSYLLEMVEGPEHAPTFVTIVSIDGEVISRGRGATKKNSQQEAALDALMRLMPPAAPENFKVDESQVLPALLLIRPEKSIPKATALLAPDAPGAF